MINSEMLSSVSKTHLLVYKDDQLTYNEHINITAKMSKHIGIGSRI